MNRERKYLGNKTFRQRTVSALHGYQETAMRSHIYQYYVTQELSTKKKLLESLREKDRFHGCKETLSKFLFEMGFEWKQINNSLRASYVLLI